MWPFRRRREETLNERLLREAGLEHGEEQVTASAVHAEPRPEIVDAYAGTYPAQDWLGVRSRAMARPDRSDAVITARAPGVRGDEVEFAALPSGDLIVDREEGNDDLAPLAEAVERELTPPYRALGRRQEADLWALTADRIVVLRFRYDGADTLDLVSREGKLQLTADDEPVAGTVRELEEAGGAEASDFAVHAERLDGDLWEIRAAAL
jgi:hypothetical protein